MGFNDSYPQAGNAYTANVRANFTAIKNVLSQAALDGGWIRAEVVTSDPTAGNKGRIIYNETENIFKIDNGSNWIALSPSIKVGSYTGNGNDNRSITGIGFQPDVVIIIRKGTTPNYFNTKIGEPTVDSSHFLAGSSDGWATNHIQALETDGFQIGSANKVNYSGDTFHYFCLKES